MKKKKRCKLVEKVLKFIHEYGVKTKKKKKRHRYEKRPFYASLLESRLNMIF
jgi:hypothetical protein